MQKYIPFLFIALGAGALILAPLILKADFVTPYPEPITFENQQKLVLHLEAGGSLTVGTHDIGYSIWFNDAFLREYGNITPGHEADVFQTALEDYRLYIEVWKGEPFTQEASVVSRAELPAMANGSVPMTFSESGSYFVVAYLTNEIRDEASYCLRYHVPHEDCVEEDYFHHFTAEEAQRYFVGDFGNDAGLYDSNPIAYGGVRLTVTGKAISNVLFLPGIKGSRLYSAGTKRWEPFGKNDVRQLFLDASGKSVVADVHAQAGDVLAETFGQRFYRTFFDGLTADGIRWETAAYDWRLSLDDLVSKGARYDDRIYYNETSGMPYIERLLRDLAASSPTGKVTIVAHSNGGLVAKALMQRLGDAGTSALIDKIVFVGVPQSGAPRSLAAALFGYGEALPFDECASSAIHALCEVLVDRATAREFAENSPMTYHLLPSQAYFDATNDYGHPPAMFQGQTFYEEERSRYQVSLSSADELYDFALARDGGRSKPAADDIVHANVLAENLVDYARDVHARLDAWTPPAGVQVYQVAGWGAQTFSGIEFYEEPRFLDLLGKPVPRYRPAFVEEGDGVVPVPSALMMHTTETVKKYWVDLTKEKATHANLLETAGVRSLIHNILTGSNELPAYVSESQPDPEPSRTILFVLHSPLTLGLVDEHGAYTGSHEDGSVTADIPDVEYGTLGETQYLIAPAGKPYEVVLNGLRKGTFSLDILEKARDDVSTTTTVGNIPTTAATVASLTLPAITGNISDLRVDRDGNGTTDFTVTPKLGEAVVLASEPEVPEEPEPEPTPPENTPQPRTPTKPRKGSSLSRTPIPEIAIAAQPSITQAAGIQNATTTEAIPQVLGASTTAPLIGGRLAVADNAYGVAIHTLALRMLLAVLLLLALAFICWRLWRFFNSGSDADDKTE